MKPLCRAVILIFIGFLIELFIFIKLFSNGGMESSSDFILTGAGIISVFVLCWVASKILKIEF